MTGARDVAYDRHTTQQRGRTMRGRSIGEVAREAGLRTSTIRYYEAEGLIPRPMRQAGRRVYDADIGGHLLFVRMALRSGFRIAEIKPLVKGLTLASKPGDRWRSVARQKLTDLDREIAALQSKKTLLESLTKCQCASLAEFSRTQMAVRAKARAE
jgi:DNA-binding transcriptional MerR regulator